MTQVPWFPSGASYPANSHNRHTNERGAFTDPIRLALGSVFESYLTPRMENSAQYIGAERTQRASGWSVSSNLENDVWGARGEIAVVWALRKEGLNPLCKFLDNQPVKRADVYVEPTRAEIKCIRPRHFCVGINAAQHELRLSDIYLIPKFVDAIHCTIYVIDHEQVRPYTEGSGWTKKDGHSPYYSAHIDTIRQQARQGS